MKVLVDENIPKMTAEALTNIGYDVLDVRGTPKQGIDDEELWKLAISQKRLLITTDKGFCRKRNEFHYGILVIRLRRPNWIGIHDRVLRALTFAHWRPQDWQGRLVVMRDRTQSVWRNKQKRR